MDVRRNSDQLPAHHSLICFCIQDGMCLLRGKNWIFMYIYVFQVNFVPVELEFIT
jgi:hypothetical protein